jgi:subtilisin family serine protease
MIQLEQRHKLPMKFFIYSLFFLTTTNASTYSQTPGWHLLDADQDKVYGAGIKRSYTDLLKGKTPRPVVVAVIDGGVDTLHEALKNNLWQNPGEQAGIYDIDKNGYTGDVHGWNFLGNKDGLQVTKECQEYQRVYFLYKERFCGVHNIRSIKPAKRELYRQWVNSKNLLSILDSAAPLVYRDRIVKDNVADIEDKFYGNGNLTGAPYAHGTHVAGIIAGSHVGVTGLYAIAPSVQLMIIRAVPNGDEHDKDIAVAIRYAVDNGAKVINMSFSKRISPSGGLVKAAIYYAERHDVLLVAAAGNDGMNIDKTPVYPTPFYRDRKRAANYLVVGASGPTKENLIASFSNYGLHTVDVFAPGIQIYSSVPGNRYVASDGTSMAAPVVTGIAAMLKAYFPRLTAVQIRNIIIQSARKISFHVAQPFSGQQVPMQTLCYSGGIVNAYAAIQLAERITQ